MRAQAEIRAASEDIAAYSLGYIGSRHAQSPSMADANLVLVDRHHGTRRDIEESVSHLARGTHGPLSVILQS